MQDFEKASTQFVNQIRVEKNKVNSQLHLNNSIKNYFEYEGALYLRQIMCEIIDEKLKSLERFFPNSIEDKSESYLSVKEVCKFLNISRISLYNQKKNPHFPKPKRIGRRVIYSKNSLIEFLDKIKSYNREPP